jgi:hypothetical protein
LGTRDDLVRGATRLLLVVWAVTICLASSTSALVATGGSFRVDLQASETAQLVLKNLTTVVGFSGETWRTDGRVTLTDGEFSAFDVTDERTFGPFRLRSLCVFNPDVGFSYLASTARFALLDVEMGNYAFLSRDASLSYNQLTARWTEGDVSLSGVWRVGLCLLEFRNALVAGQWYVPSCDLFMDVRSAFTCTEGFDYLRVTGRFPRVPFLSNDVIETELRLTIQFETDRKSFTPSLRMRAQEVNACVTPRVQLVGGGSPLEVSGVELYGWTIECSVEDFAELLLATSLDPTRNRELTGEADYWEAWKLHGMVGNCCGRDLLWELSTYFTDSGAALFSWGLTTISVEIPLGERLTARVGAEFGETSPRWLLNAGFEVRW